MDFDIRINYDQGFESICLEGQKDDAAALIAALKMVQRKRRNGGTYRPIAGVTVTPASHKQYRKVGD